LARDQQLIVPPEILDLGHSANVGIILYRTWLDSTQHFPGVVNTTCRLAYNFQVRVVAVDLQFSGL